MSSFCTYDVLKVADGLHCACCGYVRLHLSALSRCWAALMRRLCATLVSAVVRLGDVCAGRKQALRSFASARLGSVLRKQPLWETSEIKLYKKTLPWLIEPLQADKIAPLKMSI